MRKFTTLSAGWTMLAAASRPSAVAVPRVVLALRMWRGMGYKVGDEATAKLIVSENDTAIAMRSGSLAVFATPALVALCEEAAVKALKCGLSEDETTVGTKMEISHDHASCINATITAFARVSEIDGRFITLSVWAQDEAGIIGRGTHQRARVRKDLLMTKAKQRLFGRLTCPQ